MGLFKSKKSLAAAASKEDGSSSIPTSTVDAHGKQQRKRKKFSPFRKSKPPARASAETPREPVDDPPEEQRDNPKEAHDEDDDIGDIPRSISAPSQEGDGEGGREDDQDSIGSPCGAMLDAQNNKRAARLREMLAEGPASIERLRHYIAALSQSVSPDPSAELPSRALRCLFSLSEHSSQKEQRIDMVRASCAPDEEEKEEGADDAGDVPPPSLVPALLSFLQRCPRDSSEQYLTLLVLNNLSIPTQNKRLIGLEHGGAKALGRLLCEDPGCHLLVIILVNLTFGDDALNRDLLTASGTSGRRVRSGEGEKEYLSCGGDVQLVDSLSYALLLASLTTEQLSTIGPIPLNSPEGVRHTPRKLLSLLFSLLESKMGIRYGRNGNAAPSTNGGEDASPLSLAGDDCPFPETARWCLSALKNLTRPSKLSPSTVARDAVGVAGGAGADLSEEIVFHGDASAVAARAILDAGILPLLLRILRHKEDSAAQPDENGAVGGSFYSWQSNTAQDAALYTLMHIASVPQMRRTLREDYRGCAGVLVSILNYGKVISDKLKDAATSGSSGEDDADLGRTSLQCLKARMALSNLVLSGTNDNTSKYGSATTLGEHETHAFVDLLSHCLHGRAKEGAGAYSAATFSLKGALHVIKCILSEPKNRELFASSSNGSRLNMLLLKAVARYLLLGKEITEATMDAEAVEHAVVSIQRMTLCGLDESVIGFSSPVGHNAFLPAMIGNYGVEANSVVAKVFTAYLGKDGITPRGRHAANQILYRLHYLRFEGFVADLACPEKSLPSDYDIDDNLLAAIKNVSGEVRKEGATPKEYIFSRAISRTEKEGIGSKVFTQVFTSGERTVGSKTFSSPLVAAEELAAEQPEPIDTIAVANNIAYFADGADVYYGYQWRWEDGQGDFIERIYSAAATEDQVLASKEMNDSTERSEPYSPPRKGLLAAQELLGRLKMPIPVTDENEPFAIFGFKCGAPICGNRGY